MPESSESSFKKPLAVREETSTFPYSTEDFNKKLVDFMPRLFRYAMSLTQSNIAEAEDLVQETAKKALSGKDRFDGKHFETWIFKIMRNTRLDSQSSANSKKIIRGEGAEALVDGAPFLEDKATALDSRKLAERVLEGIEALPARQREAMILRAQEYTEKEMSQEMGTTGGTVKKLIHTGRKNLRKRLADEGLDS